MRKWRIESLRLFPNWEIRCEDCDIEMVPFIGTLLNFALDKSNPYIEDSYAVDVWMRCPKCFYVEVFGVAISKEEYAQVINPSRKIIY